MNNAQFRCLSLNVVMDIGLQRLQILAVLIQGVEHLFLERESRYCGVELRLLIVQLQTCADLGHEFSSNICHGFHCRRLKLFESSVIEYLSDGSLESFAIDPRCHKRALL